MSKPALSKKVQFLNARHPRSLLLGGDLLVQFVPTTTNGHDKLEMFIRVGENATALAIKQSASEIAGWRHALTEFQGHSEIEEHDALYAEIKKVRADGASLDDIATMVNQKIADDIEHSRSLFNKNESWWLLSLRAARDMLRAMGCSAAKTNEVLESALADIESGRPIFGGVRKKKSGKPTYFKNQAPITTSHIQRTLKKISE